MLKTAKLFVAAITLAFAGSAQAADLYTPPAPQAPEVVYRDVSQGGWYLRGDVDYHWADLRGNDYVTYPDPSVCPGACPPGDDFDITDLKGAFSIGGGIGYQVNSYFRTDLTADYWFDSDFTGQSTATAPCAIAGTCYDESSMSGLVLLANAYADLGTYHRVTPYVGAGIGGARISWDNFVDQSGTSVEGADSWRFAWALMAGASYCLTDNLDLDLGYRFTRIEGGRMFNFDEGVGPGFDHGFNVHEVRAGLRYSFGAGATGCGEQMAAYDGPVYK